MGLIRLRHKSSQAHSSHFAGLVATLQSDKALLPGYQGVAAIAMHRQSGYVMAGVGCQMGQNKEVFVRLNGLKLSN